MNEVDNKKFIQRIKRLAKLDCVLSECEIEDARHKLEVGQCQICRQFFDPSHLCIDHDHKTKRYRGILCTRCNYLGGYIDRLVSGKGNIDLLPEFYKYLKGVER